MAQKETLITVLESSAYVHRWGGTVPVDGFDEAPARALLAALTEDPTLGDAQTAARLERLVIQESEVEEALRAYETVRDNVAETVVDFVAVWTGMILGALQTNDVLTASAIQDAYEDSASFLISQNADPNTQAALAGSLNQVSADLSGTLLGAIDSDPEQIIAIYMDSIYRQMVVDHLMADLRAGVEPTLDKGVRSVTGEGDTWTLRGNATQAAIQGSIVGDLSRWRSDYAQQQFEHFDVANEFNAMATSLADLLGNVPLFVPVRLWMRVQSFATIGTEYLLLADEPACIRNLAAIAGNIAFMPTTVIIEDCDDVGFFLGRNAPASSALLPGLDDARWQVHVLPTMAMATDETISAADNVVKALEQANDVTAAFAAFQASHASLAAAAHEAFVMLRPPAGGTWSADARAAAQQSLECRTHAIQLALALREAANAGSTVGVNAELADALDGLAAARDSFAEIGSALHGDGSAAAGRALLIAPLMVAQIADEPGSVTVTVRNIGGAALDDGELRLQGAGEPSALAVPRLAPGEEAALEIPLMPRPAGSYQLRLETGTLPLLERGTVLLSVVAPDLGPGSEPAAAESPAPTVAPEAAEIVEAGAAATPDLLQQLLVFIVSGSLAVACGLLFVAVRRALRNRHGT